MLFTTTTQWVAIAVAMIAGWLFGLASHPGGKKWKARYLAERDGHAETTRRATELERDNVRLTKTTPVAAPVRDERVVPVEDTTRGPIARAAAEPAYRDPAIRTDDRRL